MKIVVRRPGAPGAQRQKEQARSMRGEVEGHENHTRTHAHTQEKAHTQEAQEPQKGVQTQESGQPHDNEAKVPVPAVHVFDARLDVARQPDGQQDAATTPEELQRPAVGRKRKIHEQASIECQRSRDSRKTAASTGQSGT